MKHIYTIFVLAIFIMVGSCASDDDAQRRLVVTTVSEIQFVVGTQGIMIGDTIGAIPGTSSRGSVTFAIVSQTIDAFGIMENSGELIVSNSDLIVENEETTVEVVVSVTREDVTENTNVSLTILTACPDVNISAFIGTLSVANPEISGDIVPGIGSLENECNSILTLTGGDPLGIAECFDSVLEIIFLEGDGNTGQVILERQDYCIGGVEIDGTGTYNLENGTITIAVNITEAGFTDPFGTVTISCASTVDTSIWEGNLDYEDLDFGDLATGTGSAGCGSLTLTGDVGFFLDCTLVPTINYILTPSSPDATSGTITAARQPYSCFDGSTEFLSYEATGTYDEVTGEIELNHEFFDGDESFFAGTTLVTATN